MSSTRTPQPAARYPPPSMRPFVRFVPRAVLIGTSLCISSQLAAQSFASPRPPAAVAAAKDSLFTAEDGLDIVSYSALDLTSDGRWLAATSASRRDALGVDYRRDG